MLPNKFKVILALSRNATLITYKFLEYSGEHAIGYFDCVGFEFLRFRTRPGKGGGGGTPLQEANRLIGMCRWMGSHFHDWTDYNGVANFRIFGVSRDSKWEDTLLKK